MSLARGRYGIEYDPRRVGRNASSPGIGWVFVIVAIIAAISLAWTLLARLRAHESAIVVDDDAAASVVVTEPVVSEKEAFAAPAPPPVGGEELNRRPARLRNLLMRLEVAERERKLEMAVTTIEQIRSLPGAPAADIDDSLARRLGELNVRRLFGERSAQWVKAVAVRGGDSAARIARENGSTFASLALLNEGCDLRRLRPGQKLLVMDHPRFRLEIDRVRLTADLFLNGKFFRRYDLVSRVGCRSGRYALSDEPRRFWEEQGLSFKRFAAAELEQLLPAGTPVLVGVSRTPGETDGR